MTTQSVRPRGRRPGHDDTRGTIASTALAMFDQNGYDGTSVRAIAREAGVDPALVHHYFSSKSRLFTSVLLRAETDIAGSLDEIALDGPREMLGRRLAQSCLEAFEAPRYREALGELMGAEDGPGRRRMLAEFLAREVFAPIATSAGHDNALLRGQLAASTLLGLMTGRHFMPLGALSTVSAKQLAEPLGRVLQHYLVESW